MNNLEKLKYGVLITIRDDLDAIDDKIENENNPALKANLKIKKVKLMQERAY